MTDKYESYTLDIFVLDVEKEILCYLEEREKVFLLSVTHALNELNMSNRFFAWASNYDDKHWLDRRAGMTQALFFGKIYAMKIYQFYELLRKYYFAHGMRNEQQDAPLSKRFHDYLPCSGKRALKDLKAYFSKENLIERCRNEFSAHYDLNKTDIRKFDNLQSHEKQWYVSQSYANTLFYASDMLFFHSLFNQKDAAPIDKSIDNFLNDIIVIGGHAKEFADAFQISVLRRYTNSVNYKKIQLPNTPVFEDVKLPFFCRQRRTDQ